MSPVCGIFQFEGAKVLYLFIGQDDTQGKKVPSLELQVELQYMSGRDGPVDGEKDYNVKAIFGMAQYQYNKRFLLT